MTDYSDFHEVWWIYSDHDDPWSGLRIAHFRKAAPDGALVVVITGEHDRRRVGPRIWDDIREREGWVKVKQIDIPALPEIGRALMVNERR